MRDDPEALPPAFPPWMRRADPLLAAEETNDLYRFFRARRLRRAWPGRHLATLAADLAIFPGPWMVAVALPGLTFPAVLGAMALLAARAALATLRTTERMPDSLAEALGSTPTGLLAHRQRQVLADLWQANVSGEVLVEALWLERREHQLAEGRLRIAASVVALLAFMTAARALAKDANRLDLTGAAIMLPGFAALAVVAVRQHVGRDGALRAAGQAGVLADACLRPDIPGPIRRATVNAGLLFGRVAGLTLAILTAMMTILLLHEMLRLRTSEPLRVATATTGILLLFSALVEVLGRWRVPAQTRVARATLERAAKAVHWDLRAAGRRAAGGD